MQHQITEPSLLLDQNGELIQKGYATSPLLYYNRHAVKQMCRLKEWDYYLIYNNSFGVALTVGSSPFVSIISITFLDFINKAETSKTSIVPGQIEMPLSSQQGDIVVRSNCTQVAFVHDDDCRRLTLKTEDILGAKSFDVSLLLYPEPKDSMVIATPFYKDKKAFYYNQKIIGMRVYGEVTLNGQSYKFYPENSFGLLDWGRGVWPYHTTWYWSAAQGVIDHSLFGFNFGYGFGDTSAATENMLFYNGIASKLSDVYFDISKGCCGRCDYMKESRIYSTDHRVELSFKPIFDRSVQLSVIVLSTNQHQVFGTFNGSVILDCGKKIFLDNFLGFAERVENRW